MIVVASCGHNCDDERIYYKQINTLITNGYQVKYFAYCNKSYLDNEYSNNIEYRFFNSTEITQKQYKTILFNLLIDTPPKIFHIHDMELLPVAYKLKKRFPDVKIIYDVHEDLEAMWDTFSSYSGIIKKIINTMLSRYEKKYLTCVDQFILANRFAEQKKYKLYAPCLVIENFPLLKKTMETSNHMPTKLLYHGQLSDERGIDNLVKAFHVLSKNNPNLELLLIGSFRKKKFEQTLRLLIQNNDKIKLQDSVEHHKIWEYLAKSDIGIIPFKNVLLCQKNTPTKLFEYMLADCAIVASDLEPITEFCHESASWAKPGDVDSLISAIEYYLNNQEQYIAHKKINYKSIETSYNWESISKNLLNTYREILN